MAQFLGHNLEAPLAKADVYADHQDLGHSDIFLKPIEIKRMARVPYRTVIRWIEVGHPRAGVLRSVDLADSGHRHSYRIRWQDWDEFQAKLQTPQCTGKPQALARRRPETKNRTPLFHY